MCIDLFVLSQAYTDIATLSTLSQTTCGSLYHYCPFNPMMDQDQLLNDLKWNVSRPQVRPSIGAVGAMLLLHHACSLFQHQIVLSEVWQQGRTYVCHRPSAVTLGMAASQRHKYV